MRRESSRADILVLHRRGLTNTEVADEVGCTRQHVSSVLRAEGVRQRSKRPNRFRGREKVERFQSDPLSFDPATRLTPWATQRILFQTKELLNDDHLAAEAHVEGCLRLFQARKVSARTRVLWTRASCDHVTAVGLQAIFLRRKRRLDDAVAAIDAAIAAAESRACCLAESHRRKAMILLDLRRGSEALHAVNTAKRLYEAEVLGPGALHHNLDGKPLESCLVGRATIHFYLGDFQSGQEDAAEALRTIALADPPTTRARIGEKLTEIRDGRRRYFRFLRGSVASLNHLCRSAARASGCVFEHSLSEIRDFAGCSSLMPAPRLQR